MSRTGLLTIDQSTKIRKMLRSVLLKRNNRLKQTGRAKKAASGRDEKFDLILLDDAMLGAERRSTHRGAGSHSGIRRIFLAVSKIRRSKGPGRRSVTQPKKPESISLGRIEVNFRSREVAVRGQTVRLTAKEFELLRYLIENSNSALPHRKILQAVWGAAYRGKIEYLRVFINRLRQKIEQNPSNPRYLLTEPWFGYRFHPPQKA